ncbi:50S ribosomal protein L11 methyltransferase [Deltaproteobacteria bacterium IMCC39524]|nr:50S ribosomal protein L11 methyltransferase [Deltaproteobacteria bacterium IMCC39524]
MYKPFTIGSQFRITPPNGPAGTGSCVDLVMQRGAFGSGEHETTESCLKLLEQRPEVKGAQVLDLGSGTGILAIAALKLGASHVVCVDIEQDAVESARINCRLNHIDHQVTHITGTLDAVTENNFDFILANIYGDILLDLAESLTTKLKPGGLLLLSGILWEYNFDVRQAYERMGCEVVSNHMLEEFSTALMIRQS